MPVVYDELTCKLCPVCGAPLRYEEFFERGKVSEWLVCDCGYVDLLDVKEEASEK